MNELELGINNMILYKKELMNLINTPDKKMTLEQLKELGWEYERVLEWLIDENATKWIG